jgi:hypothetical protein
MKVNILGTEYNLADKDNVKDLLDRIDKAMPNEAKQINYALVQGVVTATLMNAQIADEVKNIEKWSGEAYCGPYVNGAGPKGDEVYQALEAIKQFIQ